jgi:hypothetical protein
MASTSRTKTPDWVSRPPQAFSIVTGFFPETKPKGDAPACRPLLVTQVLRSRRTGEVALRVAYGTSRTKFPQRANIDLIVQNLSDLDECGLQTATRFVVAPDTQIIRPWTPEFFCPWGGSPSPRRGHLPVDLQREYAWLMANHLGNV